MGYWRCYVQTGGKFPVFSRLDGTSSTCCDSCIQVVVSDRVPPRLLKKIQVESPNMKLPDEILNAVKAAFEPHHTWWHIARIPESQVPPNLKPTWKQARAAFPGLIARGSAGAGEQFLRFHRDMMRNYKWLLSQHPGAGVAYQPWTDIPKAVADLIETWGLPVQQHLLRVRELTNSGSADELGNHIEPNPQGAGIHDYSHGAVAELEDNVTAPEFSMGSSSTSHRNLVFYELHGWIDERLADWQRAHGEDVDQSPLDPAHGGHSLFLKSLPLSAASERVRDEQELFEPFLQFPRGGGRPAGGQGDAVAKSFFNLQDTSRGSNMADQSGSYTGVGPSLEDAARAAHDQVPASGEMKRSTVSEIAISSGGFTGLTEFKVTVRSSAE